ncbi:MAG: glycosyltransferase family 39 protein [Cyanobacteria bacterium P01_A01_bin.37]
MTRKPQSLSQFPTFLQPDTPLGLAHYSMLVAIIGVGIVLRFWHLDTKALWLDEVIGALFSVGYDLADVPLNQFFDLSSLETLFRLNTDATCADITRSVTTDSVHPPLYFCLAHQWLSFWQPEPDRWLWVLRSLPALLGVVCIPAIYGLNRVMCSPVAGLVGAALMAVSPFAIYLSQEARHYTLPMLFTLLTLLGLAKIQQAIVKHRSIPWRWLLLWALLSSLGMYVHYFYILVVVAQVAGIGAVLLWSVRHYIARLRVDKRTGYVASAEGDTNADGVEAVHGTAWKRMRQQGGRLSVALIAVVVSYVPWMSTLLHHFDRPETDWLKPYNPDWSDRLAPIYQTLSSWLLMVVAFPIEEQPWTIAGISALAMLAVGGWILFQAMLGIRQRWRDDVDQRPMLLLLGVFVGCVILQFFVITYGLDKDVTSVPRYAFVYYPGLAALVAIGLTQRIQRFLEKPTDQREYSLKKQATNRVCHALRSPMQHPVAIAILAGIISSLFVVNGFVFQKGYYPATVARDLTFEGDRPVMLVVSYQSLQEVGLGLSFALELKKRYEHEPTPPVRIAFIHRPKGYRQVWRSLSEQAHDLPLPLNLWVVASPGMKTKDYPETLMLRKPNRNRRVTCTIDPEQFHRIGFPYQLFRCPQRNRS